MLTTALFLLAAAPEPGPTIAPGANRAFHEAVLVVEERLSEADWSGAREISQALPKKKVLIKWDDSAVPADSRAEFAKARERGLDQWRIRLKIEFELTSGNPDVLFTFEPLLRTLPGAKRPAGAAHFFSINSKEPRLETVIGLKREDPPVSIHPANITNEVSHAIGQYLGVDENGTPGTLMGRLDTNEVRVFQALQTDFAIAALNLNVSEQLRAAVEEKRRLAPTRPKLSLHPNKIDVGTIAQGDKPQFVLQLTNTGDSDLAIAFKPDCTCVLADTAKVIPAGQTAVVAATFDSSKAQGRTQHKIELITNELDRPKQEVAVIGHVKPIYRLLFPEGSIAVTDSATTSLTAYLILDPDRKITPKQFAVNGMEAEVNAEPWQGTLADPSIGEGPMPREGYKINISVKNALPGRMPSTLLILTDSQVVPRILKGFYVQRGIVAMPERIFVGEVGKNPSTFKFLVSRPGRPFKVLGVSSDLSYLQPKAAQKTDTEYEISVAYSGTAPSGLITGRILIKTDDPSQPELIVPVQGTAL